MALSKQSDKMLITVLELLDDLERALIATVEPDCDSAQFQAYRAGIKQVYDGGQQTLNQYGVRKFDAENEPFDPSLHEAVRREPRTDLEPNRVAEVFQAGYLIEERLLRAARVSVSVSE
jgi:molecular chaperone GrpE